MQVRFLGLRLIREIAHHYPDLAILEHSPTKPVLIFVSSRRQTRLTALDLISYCAADDDPKRFLHMPEEDAMAISGTMKDKALRDTLVFGVGIHHAGLDNADRATVEELFLNNKIQVLVCTSTLACKWGEIIISVLMFFIPWILS